MSTVPAPQPDGSELPFKLVLKPKVTMSLATEMQVLARMEEQLMRRATCLRRVGLLLRDDPTGRALRTFEVILDALVDPEALTQPHGW